MARIKAGAVELGWREWGAGEVTLVFLHGNLSSKDWIELAAEHLPAGIRLIGIDWRGCGDSDRPAPAGDFSNYSIAQHAADMLAALDALGVGHCHLITHSTGGIIAMRMLLAQPERFGRVLHLDPVAPMSIPFTQEATAGFGAMKDSRAVTHAVMATTMPSIFVPESMAPGGVLQVKPGLEANGALFEKIVDQTFSVSDGIWFGTPAALTAEYNSGELARRMAEVPHPQLVLWGELDGVIALADLERMAAEMPDCRLVKMPGIGHSMNVENPALFAGYIGGWFGGLAR